MQFHGPSGIIKDREQISASLNNSFAVVKVGPVSFFLLTPEECDWLIAAAVEAKQMLSPPAPEPVPSGEGGVLFPAGDDDEPACECSHPQDDHDDDSRDHECRRKGCGCLRWRTAAPKAQPEPPRVVAGTVVPRLRRLAVAE